MTFTDLFHIFTRGCLKKQSRRVIDIQDIPITDDKGNVYTGDWKDDKKHGKGEMRYQNGDLYSGDWIDGQRHGQGKFSYNDGNVLEGLFENDKFIGLNCDDIYLNFDASPQKFQYSSATLNEKNLYKDMSYSPLRGTINSDNSSNSRNTNINRNQTSLGNKFPRRNSLLSNDQSQYMRTV